MTDSDKKSPKTRENAAVGIGFEDLREGRCKFPLGGIAEPPERFCGEPTQPGFPYCLICQQQAYSRPERRR